MESLFNKWCWKNWTATCGRIKLDRFLTSCTKINSKWMKDLNVRQESIKILEKNRGSKLCDLGCSTFLLDMSPKAREIKAQMNNWDFIKIKTFWGAWVAQSVKWLPSAQVPGSWDQVPQQAPCLVGSLLLPLPLPASLPTCTLSL